MSRGALEFQLSLIYHLARALKRRANAARVLWLCRRQERTGIYGVVLNLSPSLIQTHTAQNPLLWGRSGCVCGAQKVRVRWGGVARVAGWCGQASVAWRLCVFCL